MTRRKILLNQPALWFLGFLAILLLAASPASADTLDDLKKQIQLLQEKVEQLEARQSTDEKEKKEEAEKIAKLPKGSFMLPNMDTVFTIGGYAKLDAIFSDQSAGAFSQSDEYLAVPVLRLDGQDEGEDDQVTIHARQSRIFLRSDTPTRFGNVRTHIEGDFFGTNGNQLISNSNGFRLRHAYGQIGKLLAGQYWSTFMLLAPAPETADFGGPTASTFIRQAQIRWTEPMPWGSLMFAVENPETWLTDRGGVDDDDMPDLIGRVNFNTGFGNFSFAAMVRHLSYEAPGGIDADEFGAAVTVGGVIPTFGKDVFTFEFNFGNGLGRYMITMFGDAVYDAANNELELIDQWGGYVSYRHYWTDTIRSSVAYSYGEADYPTELTGTAVNKDLHSVHANLFWSPVPRVDLGVEYMYGLRELEDGREGDINRLQFTAVYRFF